jgi:hypothetical protein
VVFWPDLMCGASLILAGHIYPGGSGEVRLLEPHKPESKETHPSLTITV